MQTKVKTLSIQSVVVALIATVTWFVILAWENASRFIKNGLSDSQKIRVAEKTSCSVAQNQNEPHFTGCNSIL